MNRFYLTHSYAKCSTSADITPLLILPSAKATYYPYNSSGELSWNPTQLLQEARELARGAGFNPADYDLHVLRLNAPIPQSWANIGYSGAWLFTSHPATTIHEIGHNLGLHHANLWDGPIDGVGTNREYGDPLDVMGNSARFSVAGFNTIRKGALGWLDESHFLRVTNTGIYRLYAHDVAEPAAGRTYALRIRKDGERDYWIEKRQSFDFSDDMLTSGVLAYWDEWSQSNGGTHLLDPDPSPGQVLPLNHTLRDSAVAVRIIPLRQSEDRSYAEVAVIFGSAALNLLPGLLHYSGFPNQNVRLQSSFDLLNWQDLQMLSSPTGHFVFPLTESSTLPKRFYRIIPN